VFRGVLKDREFDLPQDFERVLRKYKGDQVRRPALPMVTVIDTPRVSA
jgi:hypothetical protein